MTGRVHKGFPQGVFLFHLLIAVQVSTLVGPGIRTLLTPQHLQISSTAYRISSIRGRGY